ncbi:hypothetical protein [Kribbella antiqua]|uniref:hypothetical protein n=1 Tax=Kribbella antiqua TaxID=2512217 RepID=UPI001043F133|nr:hypothetical protein [Kribbella antiqua]
MNEGGFTVEADAGVSATPTTLTAIRAALSGPAELITGLTLRESIQLKLGTGQPLKPLLPTYTLPEPLPAASSAVVLRGDPSVEVVTVLPTRLSADRRTLTASTAHLSIFSVITNAVEPAIAGFLGTHGERPACDGRPPNWVDDAVFITPDGDPPLLVCTGSDTRNRDLLVVKLTNNRGTGIAVTASARWRWQWTGAAGGIKSTVSDRLSNVSDPAADRTLYVMPGQQLHLGFSSPARNPTTITMQGAVSTSALGYGIAWQAADEIEARKPYLRTMLAGAFTAVCLVDVIADPLRRAGNADLLPIISALAKCGVSNYDDISTAARAAIPPADWPAISPGLKSGMSAILRRLNAYLTLASVFWAGAEAVADLAQDPYARRVSIFTKTPSPDLTMHPGRLGALRVGMTGLQAIKTGYVVKAPTDAICGIRYELAPQVRRLFGDDGRGTEFRDRHNPDDLDTIWIKSRRPRTPEGAGSVAPSSS